MSGCVMGCGCSTLNGGGAACGLCCGIEMCAELLKMIAAVVVALTLAKSLPRTSCNRSQLLCATRGSPNNAQKTTNQSSPGDCILLPLASHPG